MALPPAILNNLNATSVAIIALILVLLFGKDIPMIAAEIQDCWKWLKTRL